MSTIPFSPKQKPDESTLTDRPRKVLDAIRTHIDEQGFAPSFREIGNAAGLKSPSSVKHQLQVLEDKGFIRMNANKGRAIEVVNLNDEEPNGKVAQVIPFRVVATGIEAEFRPDGRRKSPGRYCQ